MPEKNLQNIPVNPEYNIELADDFGEMTDVEKRVYVGEFSIALLQEMLSAKNDVEIANEDGEAREKIQKRKEKFFFLLFENYRELLLKKPADENLDLIEATLKILASNEVAGGNNASMGGYVCWSVYRLNACQESEKPIDIALEIIKSGGADATDSALLKTILKKDIAYSEHKLMEFLESADTINDRAINRVMIAFADLSGAEEVRKKIDERIIGSRENKIAMDSLEYARALITPDSNKEAILDLKEFYQNNIKFEEYGINQLMNEKDLEILKELIDINDRVFEMGCGTGRLISALSESGYAVSGCDYVERHIEITKDNLKQKAPTKNADVFQKDWHATDLEEKSFGVVYSLGRNILHDYSLLDQSKLFREAARILKPGGQFIFDIPNREKGGYGKMVTEYSNEMRKRGIRNFRYGAIYDSPDNKHFATRYAYSQEDITELARFSGFEIAEVRKEKLETGKDDENLYFVLKKKAER